MIRALVIDEAARAQARRVIEHAKAHPYRPGDPVPGDNPDFVAQLGSYRAVFTYTKSDGTTFRHLSVSVPGRGYPHPAAIFTIAELFGLTGWDGRTLHRAPADWMVSVNRDEHCVVVGQRIEPQTDQEPQPVIGD